MAREIVVDTHLLLDLCEGGPKDDVGTKDLQFKKPDKWAVESRPRKSIKRKMKRGLRSLQLSDNEIDAKRAIWSLCYKASFDGESTEADKAERKFCQRLFRLNTIPVILDALTKWKTSLHFVSGCVILLIKITYFEPQSLPCMVKHNGIDLLLEVGTCHHDDLNLSADILMVLENLSHTGLHLNNHKTRKNLDVATSNCIHFVATKMQVYPDDDILQRNACAFLENIGYCVSCHHKLYRRGIPFLLENVIENFSNSNARVVSKATEALYAIDNLY